VAFPSLSDLVVSADRLNLDALTDLAPALPSLSSTLTSFELRYDAIDDGPSWPRSVTAALRTLTKLQRLVVDVQAVGEGGTPASAVQVSEHLPHLRVLHLQNYTASPKWPLAEALQCALGARGAWEKLEVCI